MIVGHHQPLLPEISPPAVLKGAASTESSALLSAICDIYWDDPDIIIFFVLYSEDFRFRNQLQPKMPAVSAFSNALLFGLAGAVALVPTAVDNCAAYPAIYSYLGKCKTATSFCESLLGRSPKTMTETYSTYTTTIPKTLTFDEVSTTTITGSTTLPLLTQYSISTIV